jgi:hypothetical protein
VAVFYPPGYPTSYGPGAEHYALKYVIQREKQILENDFFLSFIIISRLVNTLWGASSRPHGTPLKIELGMRDVAKDHSLFIQGVSSGPRRMISL